MDFIYTLLLDLVCSLVEFIGNILRRYNICITN
jgi:hypothetical protein